MRVLLFVVVMLLGHNGFAADLPIPRRTVKVEARRTYEKPPAYDRNFVAATPKPIDRPAGMP